MGCVSSSSAKSASTRDEEDDVFNDAPAAAGAAPATSGKKMQRSKSLVVKDEGKRMRRTKSAVYEKGMEEVKEKEAMTKRTSKSALDGGAGAGDGIAAGEESPKIDVGIYTHVGDPAVHANEDRATAVLDLLGKFTPAGKSYKGSPNQLVSFFGVYDGHGGSSCSEYLRKNLHVNIAKNLYEHNTHEDMKDVLIKTFEDTEAKECAKFAPGSCCTTVLIKGRKVYCANAGDSMAVIYEGDDRKMTKLNDRHGVEFSKHEIKRLNDCKAEVSKDYETEGAVIARDKRGYFIKALYPTRGFGDADFKELVAPKPVVVASPTGVGVGYEGAAYEFKGKGPFWLLVGCDGLWDFMKESQIKQALFSKSTPQAMAEHLTKVAQAHPYSSYDDVTVIVCKIEYA
mmetsp:Transcript_30919/g.80906  ORF Transcript_30919/g.80906 Transcript_30919/m.80906 type:complete len:398 (+) Transcript_30919:121-1314(+)